MFVFLVLFILLSLLIIGYSLNNPVKISFLPGRRWGSFDFFTIHFFGGDESSEIC